MKRFFWIAAVITAVILLGTQFSVIAAKPWNCTASCNVQAIEGKAPASFPERVTGNASNSNQETACTEAKRLATQSAPAGTYARHCQCKCK
jgi:hypothetical protein